MSYSLVADERAGDWCLFHESFPDTIARELSHAANSGFMHDFRQGCIHMPELKEAYERYPRAVQKFVSQYDNWSGDRTYAYFFLNELCFEELRKKVEPIDSRCLVLSAHADN
ncbi:MAG TPA: hypothetical protein VJK03_03985 [Candidatus Nanoarchaeia archaeon]|nr:hypothetical protein [Candidatus Nanoarchaeia archaeon]